MKSLRCSFGLLLAALSFPALAQPAPAEPRSAEAGQRVSPATAAALARVVAPLEMGIAGELEQARKAIIALPTMDEDAKALEQEYPGLYAALWAAVEPEMRRSTEADYPSFWAALEQLYLARLTEAEAQAVMTFFKSPTGQKLLRATYGSIDATPVVAEMVKTENYALDEKQMKSVMDAAKAAAVKQIGAEDQADLWILMASIDLKKFQALGAETQKVTLEWVNKQDPEGDARIGTIMEEAMKQYMAAHPPKK
jgi:hypothetical protein